MEISSFSPGNGGEGSLVTVTGNFMLAWKSEWDSNTSYNQNDVIRYSEQYYCSRFSNNTLHPLANGWDLFSSIYTITIGNTKIDTRNLNIIDSGTLSFTTPNWGVKGLITITRYKLKAVSQYSYKTLYLSPIVDSTENVSDLGGSYCQIKGSGFGNVAYVLINDKSVDFTVNNNTEILAKASLSMIFSIGLRTTDGGVYSEIYSLGYGLTTPYGYFYYGY